MNSSKKFMLTILVVVLCIASALCGYLLVKDPKSEVYAFDPGEYFVTNITDSKSLLKSDLIIEVADKEQYKELEKNNFKVRDTIINVLRSKAYEEIRNPEVQCTLKEEIHRKLSENFKIDKIQNIYFNEFVIQ